MPGGSWSGGYTSSDLKTVIATDAEQLAAVLERALPNIPDTDVLVWHRGEGGGIVIAPNGPEIDDTD